MVTATLLFLLVGLEPAAADRPQLLVMAGEDVTSCRPAPVEWASDSSFDIAPPESVSQDLLRYLAGLSLQSTSILNATWNGVVRFCTRAEEWTALEALAALVVTPPTSGSPPDSGLAPGAPELLKPLASPLLVDKLSAIEPTDDVEARRRELALDLVRKTLEAQSTSP